jgi:3'-phosphoadenosine 5'-phosphosulfate sulfotransferase (PAPS reductase)/FAD synthetase
MNAALHAAREEGPPAGYAALERDLFTQVADIGRRYRRAALASSLSAEDMVIAHVIAATEASVEVFAIDTGRLHRETLAMIDALHIRYGIAPIVVAPDPQAEADYVAAHGRDGFYGSIALRHACCAIRKVEPLERALRGRDAWLTGQRRAHGPERAALPTHELDAARRGAGAPLCRSPCGAGQPAVRARLCVDRLRAVHTRAAPGRASASRPLVVGRIVVEGMWAARRGA